MAVDVEAVMGGEAAPRHRDAPSVDEAVEWLRELLAAGPRPVKEVEAEAKAAGIRSASLRRARGELRCKPVREGFGKDGEWVLHLPRAARDGAA